MVTRDSGRSVCKCVSVYSHLRALRKCAIQKYAAKFVENTMRKRTTSRPGAPGEQTTVSVLQHYRVMHTTHQCSAFTNRIRG